MDTKNIQFDEAIAINRVRRQIAVLSSFSQWWKREKKEKIFTLVLVG